MRKLVVLLSMLAIAGCSSKLVRFEQYSVAMNLNVDADSSVYLGEGDKFNGVLFLNPIFAAEEMEAAQVKVIQNFGRYYVCAEQFKNVWQIEPKSDGISGKYKAIDVTPEDETDVLKNISFTRYGNADKACVRFRFNGKEVFIDKKGGLNEVCE